MKKILLVVLVGTMAFVAYSEEGDVQVSKSVEDSITKETPF